MVRFHINNKGEPGSCSAEKGNCPFGEEDQHFETKNQAQEAYEVRQTSFVIAPTLSKRGETPVKMSFNELPDRGENLNVGELLKNVTPGNVLIIRRFDVQEDTQELKSYESSGKTSSVESKYWNASNKTGGKFCFPLSNFSDNISLKQAAHAVQSLLQDEVSPLGHTHAFIVAEVPKSNLKTPPLDSTYEYCEPEVWGNDEIDGYYLRNQEKEYEGERIPMDELIWKSDSVASDIKGLFGNLEGE